MRLNQHNDHLDTDHCPGLAVSLLASVRPWLTDEEQRLGPKPGSQQGSACPSRGDSGVWWLQRWLLCILLPTGQKIGSFLASFKTTGNTVAISGCPQLTPAPQHHLLQWLHGHRVPGFVLPQAGGRCCARAWVLHLGWFLGF